MKKNKELNVYKEYCTGCGLCSAVNNVKFTQNSDGDYYPQLTDKDLSLCRLVCPASGKYTEYLDKKTIWGNYKNIYIGWSSDKDIRLKASSGGALTAICCWLLQNNKVDAIIQTVADKHKPWKTATTKSYTVKQVISGCGSRYSSSSPLLNITSIIEKNERYAFVGKPCDISALRCYMTENKALENNILYFLSFFVQQLLMKKQT